MQYTELQNDVREFSQSIKYILNDYAQALLAIDGNPAVEFKTMCLSVGEIKFSADKSISGYASVFGGNDDYGDTILPGAFTKAVAVTGGEVKMYFNHGWLRRELPIGKMFIQEDKKGLYVSRAEFTPGLARANDVVASVRHGTIDGLSIGFGLLPGGFKKKPNGGREIREVAHLKEISIVDFPADAAARISNEQTSVSARNSAVHEIERLFANFRCN